MIAAFLIAAFQIFEEGEQPALPSAEKGRAGNSSKKLRLDLRKIFGAVRQGYKVPRETVGSPSLEVVGGSRRTGRPGSWLGWLGTVHPASQQGGGTRCPLRCLPGQESIRAHGQVV